MLNFRRKPAPAPRVEPGAIVAKPAPAQTTNAEKARALIAMLENGGGGAAVPPERLRDWARDLVETVERRPDAESTSRSETSAVPKPSDPTRMARLFSSAPPVLSERPQVPLPRPASPVVAPVPAVEPSVAPRIAAVARMTLTAPVPHVGTPSSRAAIPDISPVHSPADVRRLIHGTIEQDALAREHPAVIALTLVGKPSLEQASALRRLPGGQIRAVHRALRQLELTAN